MRGVLLRELFQNVRLSVFARARIEARYQMQELAVDNTSDHVQPYIFFLLRLQDRTRE